MHKGHGISITLKKNPMLVAFSLEISSEPPLSSVVIAKREGKGHEGAIRIRTVQYSRTTTNKHRLLTTYCLHEVGLFQKGKQC